MYVRFHNLVNPDSTFFGKTGRYPFKGGIYETKDKKEIEDLKTFFKHEEIKAEELTVEKPVEPKNTKLMTQLPKSWTIARIYEYADEVGITIPDTLTKLADIKLYVEALATSEE